jgi:hypothetical protein
MIFDSYIEGAGENSHIFRLTSQASTFLPSTLFLSCFLLLLFSCFLVLRAFPLQMSVAWLEHPAMPRHRTLLTRLSQATVGYVAQTSAKPSKISQTTRPILGGS